MRGLAKNCHPQSRLLDIVVNTQHNVDSYSKNIVWLYQVESNDFIVYNFKRRKFVTKEINLKTERRLTDETIVEQPIKMFSF